MPTQLKNTNLIAVEVHPNAYGFHKGFSQQIDFSIDICATTCMDAIDTGFTFEFTILGTIYKESISFEVRKYVEQIIMRCEVAARPAGYIDLPCYKKLYGC